MKTVKIESFEIQVLCSYYVSLVQNFIIYLVCQGGKPDTGKLNSSYIGMNVCGSAYENGVWSMVCVCVCVYYGSGLSIIMSG